MDREKEVLTEIAQQHEFEIISLGSNRRHMELPEYRAAIQESEAVQEQTAAALQELADMQEKKIGRRTVGRSGIIALIG